MASFGKIYPNYVIDAVNCTTVRFFWSDKLLTAKDPKLERLKLAILFTTADLFWVKKNKTNVCYQRIQKSRNRNFIHPSSFIHPCKNFIHRVKKYWFRVFFNLCFYFYGLQKGAFISQGEPPFNRGPQTFWGAVVPKYTPLDPQLRVICYT